MPSPTITATPAIINRGAADTLVDLPAAPWPSLDRIQVVDLVGPSAANRQERSNQRRTITLADNLNAVIGTLRGMVGIDPVGADYARTAHAAGLVTLASGVGTSDDHEHYLARDGSTMMWGRLGLGHSRSLFGSTAFDINSEHWFHGPGSADVGNADADRSIGLKHNGANDYAAYIYVGGTPYRFLTTFDFGVGPAGFLSASSNNRRIGTTIATELGVESSNATAGTTADLTITITGQDTFTIRATKGTPGILSFKRNATEFLRADVVAGYNWSLPLAIGTDIAIGFDAFGTPTAWGINDYSPYLLQIPYGASDAFRIAIGPYELMAMYWDHLAVAGRVTVTMALPVLSNGAWDDGNLTLHGTGATGASGNNQPRIGFSRDGQNQAALYYNGIVSGQHALRVRGSDGFDERLAYASEVVSAFSGGMKEQFNLSNANYTYGGTQSVSATVQVGPSPGELSSNLDFGSPPTPIYFIPGRIIDTPILPTQLNANWDAQIMLSHVTLAVAHKDDNPRSQGAIRFLGMWHDTSTNELVMDVYHQRIDATGALASGGFFAGWVHVSVLANHFVQSVTGRFTWRFPIDNTEHEMMACSNQKGVCQAFVHPFLDINGTLFATIRTERNATGSSDNRNGYAFNLVARRIVQHGI